MQLKNPAEVVASLQNYGKRLSQYRGVASSTPPPPPGAYFVESSRSEHLTIHASTPHEAACKYREAKGDVSTVYLVVDSDLVGHVFTSSGLIAPPPDAPPLSRMLAFFCEGDFPALHDFATGPRDAGEFLCVEYSVAADRVRSTSPAEAAKSYAAKLADGDEVLVLDSDLVSHYFRVGLSVSPA